MAGSTKRFAGPLQLANAAATLYTAPAYVPNTLKSRIMHIHVSNPTAVGHSFTLSIGADAAASRIFDAYPLPPGAALDFWGPYTIDASQIVQGFADAATTVVIEIDGLENVGP